jgi:hypothetical protein
MSGIFTTEPMPCFAGRMAASAEPFACADADFLPTGAEVIS